MAQNRSFFSRLGLVGLAFALSMPIVACESKEKPPVVDTSTDKPPAAPATNSVAPTGPPAKP